MDIAKRAEEILSTGHKLDNMRGLVRYQTFYPHTAKEAYEGNETSPGSGEADEQLFPRRTGLWEKSKDWDDRIAKLDYKLRGIHRQMHELVAEMKRAVEVDDEHPPKAPLDDATKAVLDAIITPGQKTAKSDISAGQVQVLTKKEECANV